jgi:hypothetical protein
MVTVRQNLSVFLSTHHIGHKLEMVTMGLKKCATVSKQRTDIEIRAAPQKTDLCFY